MPMTAPEYNKRELEQGRLTWEQLAVLCDYSEVDHLKENVRGGKLSWERISGAIAVFQDRERLTPSDGMAGPATRARIKVPEATPEAPVVAIDAGVKWPVFDGPAVRQPRNRAEVYEIFGDPGSKSENPTWFKNNVVECHGIGGKYPALPGVPAKYYIKVHRIVEPYLREFLRRLLISCPWFVIEVLGSHKWRTIRHEPGAALSYHSWAIAFDLNSAINFGKDYPKGKAPQMGTPAWDKVWEPDPRRINREVIDVAESCGFRSGADWDEDGLTSDETYVDLMHLEWVAPARGSNILV